jgi:hypothetical protein
MTYPRIAEYKEVRVNNWPCVSYTALAEYHDPRPSVRAMVQLKARTAGYAIAGSMMRWDSDAFGVIWEDSRQGTTHGQWFKTENEARAHFDKMQRDAARNV